MNRDQEVTPGTGNVFEDLDLPEADTALAKAKLAARIGTTRSGGTSTS